MAETSVDNFTLIALIAFMAHTIGLLLLTLSVGSFLLWLECVVLGTSQVST